MGDVLHGRWPELSFWATPYLGDAFMTMTLAVFLGDAILGRRFHDDDFSGFLGRRHTWAMPSRRWLEQSSCWLWSLVNEKRNASPPLPMWHSLLTWHSFVQFDLTLSGHLTRRSPCSTFKLCFNLLTRGAIQRLRTSVACASKLTLHLSKTRAPIHCFIHPLRFPCCSSSPNSFCNLRFLSRVFDHCISRYSKRYDLSPSMALFLTFVLIQLPGTVYFPRISCILFCISLFLFPFPFSELLRAGRDSRKVFASSPFLSFFAKTFFSSLFFSLFANGSY